MVFFNKIFLVCLISFFPFLNLNSSPDLTKPKEPLFEDSLPTPNEKKYFVVSFFSICCGIDTEAHHKFRQFIYDFQEKKKITLSYEKVAWGREGEIDYCFDLSNLSKKVAKEFRKKTKNVVKKSSLVRVKDNAECSYKN